MSGIHVRVWCGGGCQATGTPSIDEPLDPVVDRLEAQAKHGCPHAAVCAEHGMNVEATISFRTVDTDGETAPLLDAFLRDVL